MRTRNEIEAECLGDRESSWRAVEGMNVVVELLLDIRDLLSKGTNK